MVHTVRSSTTKCINVTYSNHLSHHLQTVSASFLPYIWLATSHLVNCCSEIVERILVRLKMFTH